MQYILSYPWVAACLCKLRSNCENVDDQDNVVDWDVQDGNSNGDSTDIVDTHQ